MQSCILTYTGKLFDLAEPSAGMVSIYDIAHALAFQNVRFCGHTNRFYSVAQHCVLMSEWCEPRIAPLCLLHDAAEAYLGDFSRPLKRMCPNLVELENRVLEAILEAIPLEWKRGDWDRVKDWDNIALATEFRDLFADSDNLRAIRKTLPRPVLDKIAPWSPHVAKQRFRNRFKALSAKHSALAIHLETLRPAQPAIDPDTQVHPREHT